MFQARACGESNNNPCRLRLSAAVEHWCTCECVPFLVVLTCLLHRCHMSALTDALTSSSQDSSQTSQRSVEPCSRILEEIVDVPIPKILEQIVTESKRKQISQLLQTGVTGKTLAHFPNTWENIRAPVPKKVAPVLPVRVQIQ